MTWTAIVPIKPPDDRKTRLAGSAVDRRELTDRLLAHVLSVLCGHDEIERVAILSGQAHEGFLWLEDRGRGLNEELEAARTAAQTDILVVHADLPLISRDDVSALLLAARERGGAFAPDRHRTGTNALALPRDLPFAFRFGSDSCALHAAQLSSEAAVERPGLALDIDTPDDLRLLETTGSKAQLR